MYRCFFNSIGCLVATSALMLGMPASAQMQRNFPQNALRGELAVGIAPEVTLNGKPARLSPGSRIRGADNMMVMSGALTGSRMLVHYTVDSSGLVHDVWILRPDEAARKPWPVTREQAGTWTFDPMAQTWTRP